MSEGKIVYLVGSRKINGDLPGGKDCWSNHWMMMVHIGPDLGGYCLEWFKYDEDTECAAYIHQDDLKDGPLQAYKDAVKEKRLNCDWTCPEKLLRGWRDQSGQDTPIPIRVLASGFADYQKRENEKLDEKVDRTIEKIERSSLTGEDFLFFVLRAVHELKK